MPAPERVIKLVENFRRQLGEYKSGRYNETQVRREFIDPFWKALGWDIDNESGAAEAYKDVVHEDAVKVGSATKAPDYSFRIGRERKFFLEAKKPAVDIKEDIHPAYQLRRYGWSAKLAVSVLTDFEEFAVYDCQVRPDAKDKAATARIFYTTFDKYVEQWDELYAIYSKEAVLKGSFDRFVQSGKGKRGTSAVDTAFLEEIERWRMVLAKNLASENPKLSQSELNLAVQMTIDRIIFLRICEDRGLEEYGRLQSVADGNNVYKELTKFFQQADARYNSGLFHFEKEASRPSSPDELTPKLKIGDKALADILKHLYYPASPYEFSVVPADILGSVYERFLGKVIRLTDGHNAKVEEKPEVKKAGGVYYTPKYIVDYIVKETVGKLLEGKTPDEVSKLRVLDPACGSGSFLIGAYQYLLDWYLSWYTANDPEKWLRARPARLVPAHLTVKAGDAKVAEWSLSIAEKKRILLAHIHGVDIDSQAVEVTKLSLLLKVLEGERSSSGEQLTMAGERLLPDLESNIKCGNSLIGPDYYEGKQLSMLPDEEMARVNVFDWDKGFPEAMKAGGFDAVIGNPPYARMQSLQESQPYSIEYFKKRFLTTAVGNFDLYVIFVEMGFSLLSQKGIFGYILPHKFFQSDFGEPLRKLIGEKSALNEIVHFGAEQVFEAATTYTCLLFLTAAEQKKFSFVKVSKISNPQVLFEDLSRNVENENYKKVMVAHPIGSEPWILGVGGQEKIITKLKQQSVTLGDIARKIFQGIPTGMDKVFVLKVLKQKNNTTVCHSKALEEEIEIENEVLRPFLMGKEVHRYAPPKPENVVLFPYQIKDGKPLLLSQRTLAKDFPLCWSYFSKNKKELQAREDGRFNEDWHCFSRPQNLNEFETVKVMTPEIANRPEMTHDPAGSFHTTKVYSFSFKEEVKENPKYFLGIMNSKVLWIFLQSTGYVLRGGYFTFKTNYLSPFPIPCSTSTTPPLEKQHDQMVSLVDQMLDLNKRLVEAKEGRAKAAIEGQIEATDKKIDQLVYELYGLTEEEIKVVEGEE